MSNIGENQGTSSNSAGLSTQEDLDAIFAAAFSGKPVETSSAADPGPAASSTDTEPSNTAASAQSAPGDASTTDTPAPQAGESAATNGKAPPNQNQPQNNPNDWVSTVSDEALRSRIIELINDRNSIAHKYNSDRPRLDNARKTVQQLQQRLAALEASSQAQGNPSHAQTPPAASKTHGEAPVPATLPPEWSKVAKDDPELAAAVEKLLETRLNQQAEQLSRVAEQRVQAAVAPYAQYHADDATQREFARLEQYVPNVRAVVSSPQYREWLEYYAPPAIQKMASDSTTAEDAIAVLQNFDYYARQRWGTTQQAPTAQSNEATPAQPASSTTAVADRLAQDAARRAATAVNPTSHQLAPAAPTSANAKPPTDEELNKIMQAEFKKNRR